MHSWFSEGPVVMKQQHCHIEAPRGIVIESHTAFRENQMHSWMYWMHWIHCLVVFCDVFFFYKPVKKLWAFVVCRLPLSCFLFFFFKAGTHGQILVFWDDKPVVVISKLGAKKYKIHWMDLGRRFYFVKTQYLVTKNLSSPPRMRVLFLLMGCIPGKNKTLFCNLHHVSRK